MIYLSTPGKAVVRPSSDVRACITLHHHQRDVRALLPPHTIAAAAHVIGICHRTYHRTLERIRSTYDLWMRRVSAASFVVLSTTTTNRIASHDDRLSNTFKSWVSEALTFTQSSDIQIHTHMHATNVYGTSSPIPTTLFIGGSHSGDAINQIWRLKLHAAAAVMLLRSSMSIALL